MSERVVVTGLGLITPLGSEVSTVWSRLLAGERGVTPPQRRAQDEPATKAVGEVPAAEIERLRSLHPSLKDEDDVRTLFAFGAAAEAITQAGMLPGPHPDAGVFLGAGPGANRIEDVADHLFADGSFDAAAYGRAVDTLHQGSLVRSPAQQPATRVARAYGIGGPVHAVTTACSASNQAIGLAYRSIRDGETSWCITGGSDSQINPLGLVFFVLLGASANVDPDDPASACKPFDRRRSGLVMGEGAGVVILESETHARERGARILAEVVGYGSSLDAFRTTAPPPDGRGAVEAMQYALEDGGLAPQDVDFVNAHGTGTKRNDPAEVTAIRSLFGDHADALAVSSGKGALGHLLSAAAGVAFCCCVQAVREGAVPPTANLVEPDRGCDLDLVPDPGRQRDVRAALNNSFAFGGQNACVAVRRYVPSEEDSA